MFNDGEAVEQEKLQAFEFYNEACDGDGALGCYKLRGFKGEAIGMTPTSPAHVEVTPTLYMRFRSNDPVTSAIVGLPQYLPPEPMRFYPVPIYTGGDDMNWDAIGAVGQVLGSIAVFVTLGYLAVQVKHARLEARSAAQLARLGSNREVYLAMVNNADLTASIAALISPMGSEQVGFERFVMDHGLTAAQTLQVSSWIGLWWEGMETILATVEHLDADDLASFHQRTKVFLTVGFIVRWYEENKPLLNPSAVRYIDNLLAQPG